MNQHIIKSLAAFAALFSFAACNKEFEPATSGDITINASVGAMTKVAYEGNATSFTSGDKISVYAWMGDATAIPVKRVVDGVVNTFDGSAWTPASLMRWQNNTDAHYFLGISPVRTVSSFTADPYTLDPADYTGSDLLIATNVSGVKSSDGAVALNFDHAMAKLNVNLRFRNQWTATPTVSSVKIAAKTQATVDYLAKSVTATGEQSSITVPAMTTAATGFALSYSGLQVPQSGVKVITVTIDGKDFVYESTDDIPLVGGKYTTIGLIVGKDKIELGSISVNDWAAGADLPGGEATKKAISFNLGVKYPADMNPTKTAWEAGDVIFVFFDNVAAPRFLKMRYDGAKWIYAEMNGNVGGAGCLGFVNGDSGNMRAVYLPYGSDITVAAGTDATSFIFSRNDYAYFLTATLPYTVANYELSGDFDLKAPDGFVQIYMPNETNISTTKVELREPHLTPCQLTSISADGTVNTKTLAHGAPIPGYACKDGFAFSGILAAGARNASTKYAFTMVDGDWDGTYYVKSLNPTVVYATADDRAFRIPDLQYWAICGVNMPVDLGMDIDMGGGELRRVYWGTLNLGALVPMSETNNDVFGDFYAWGETLPYHKEGYGRQSGASSLRDGKTGYDWVSYRFENSVAKDASSFSRYTGSDYTTLLPEDDAATATLKGAWRIPTIAEWQALMDTNRFNWHWDATHNGMEVTSKDPAYAGRKIFLPASGARANEWYFFPEPLTGNYWSSSLDNTGRWGAHMIYFKNNEIGSSAMLRCYGISIRPVSD